MPIALPPSPWNPIDTPWDRLRYGDVWSPGYCEISGANAARKWDEQDASGWAGAFVIYHGLRLSHFTARFSLYTREHWDEWQPFKRLLAKPPIGTLPRAKQIDHPLLAEVGIHAAVVEDVRQPVQDDHGVWTIEVAFIEWRSVLTGQQGKIEGAEAEPVDPREEVIAKLLGQVESLAAKLGQP